MKKVTIYVDGDGNEVQFKVKPKTAYKTSDGETFHGPGATKAAKQHEEYLKEKELKEKKNYDGAILKVLGLKYCNCDLNLGSCKKCRDLSDLKDILLKNGVSTNVFETVDTGQGMTLVLKQIVDSITAFINTFGPTTINELVDAYIKNGGRNHAKNKLYWKSKSDTDIRRAALEKRKGQ